MEKATLYAPGISCSHCVMTIKRAVEKLEGVSSVDGNPETKQVIVEFDASRIGLDRIQTTMAEEGYPVSQ